MKQKLIVEPTLQDELPYITPIHIKFPPESPPISRDTVIKLLRNLINITVQPSQRSGLFIFSLDKENPQFAFSWLSIPTTMAFLRLLVIFGVAAYINWNEDLVRKRFSVHSGESSTLGITEMILSTTMFCSDCIGIILFWVDQERIGNYINLYCENLTILVNDLKDKSWIQRWFEQESKKLERLVKGISIATNISILILIKPELQKLLNFIRGEDEIEENGSYFDWETLSFPIFSFFWFMILLGRLYFRATIINMIDCVQLGFKALKEHVNEFANDKIINSEENLGNRMRSLSMGENFISHRRTSFHEGDTNKIRRESKEVTLDRILKKYRTLETLLGEFNELFASHLLIGIASMVVVILMALFRFLVEVNYTLSWNAPIFAIEALAYSWVLFSLGTSATKMTREADACIAALRDVPLDSISSGLKDKVVIIN
ncbi:unnamed protein product [Orchesella dallaii]|uniref:Gustatory receptor n=1 Tax=Orchesella dallaii TaxID=48710 RepID=A0ABP1R2X7_9HEXA